MFKPRQDNTKACLFLSTTLIYIYIFFGQQLCERWTYIYTYYYTFWCASGFLLILCALCSGICKSKLHANQSRHEYIKCEWLSFYLFTSCVFIRIHSSWLHLIEHLALVSLFYLCVCVLQPASSTGYQVEGN